MPTIKRKKDTKRPMMKIAYDAIPSRDIVPTLDSIRAQFAPCRTMGYRGIENVYTAQDAALGESYTLLQHSLANGLFDVTTQFVGYGVLSKLTQDGLIRAGIEMRADEMTRKWIELTYSGLDDKKKKTEEPVPEMTGIPGQGSEETEKEAEKKEQEAKNDARNNLISVINKELDKFKVRKLFRDASATCGYFGGCLAYIDVGDLTDDELKLPLRLDKDTFEPGSFQGFRLIEPFNVAPGNYDARSPLSKYYFKPRSWFIMGKEVHASRFLYFSEDRPPTLMLPSYNFFGIPLAQTVLDTVTHFTSCRESVMRLLEKYSLTVMKTDMAALLTGGSDGDIRRRIEYFLQNRNNEGLMVVDYETEDITNMTTQLSGVTDIVKQCMEMVAAYFGEPVVKLWGISPSGLNSTGEADMQNHFDHINSIQERILRTPLMKAIKLLQMNKLGKVDKALSFDFLPLGDENDLTVAQVQQTKVGTMVQLYDRGIIDGEEARQSLADDSKSPFTNIDLDKEIVPPNEQQQEDPMGGNPYAGGGMMGGGIPGMENPMPEPNGAQSGMPHTQDSMEVPVGVNPYKVEAAHQSYQNNSELAPSENPYRVTIQNKQAQDAEELPPIASPYYAAREVPVNEYQTEDSSDAPIPRPYGR